MYHVILSWINNWDWPHSTMDANILLHNGVNRLLQMLCTHTLHCSICCGQRERRIGENHRNNDIFEIFAFDVDDDDDVRHLHSINGGEGEFCFRAIESMKSGDCQTMFTLKWHESNAFCIRNGWLCIVQCNFISYFRIWPQNWLKLVARTGLRAILHVTSTVHTNASIQSHIRIQLKHFPWTPLNGVCQHTL